MPAGTFAVFGGSFNPPHVAHQMVCLWVLETQPVDAVLMVPCFRHPFEKHLAPFVDRLAMCRLAAAPFGERVRVSEIEAEIGGESSRTLTTLEALAACHPGVGLRLVIGADILAERTKWWRWPEIERLAPPLVVGRAGYAGPGAEVELPPVSSTEIRARLGRREDPGGLLPRSVSAYIRARGLYA